MATKKPNLSKLRLMIVEELVKEYNKTAGKRVSLAHAEKLLEQQAATRSSKRRPMKEQASSRGYEIQFEARGGDSESPEIEGGTTGETIKVETSMPLEDFAEWFVTRFKFHASKANVKTEVDSREAFITVDKYGDAGFSIVPAGSSSRVDKTFNLNRWRDIMKWSVREADGFY